MKSYREYINEAKSDPSSSKVKAMNDLVTTLREVLGKYDISTRHYVWDHLNNVRGKELMLKILRNPKTYFPNSEFTKLVEKK